MISILINAIIILVFTLYYFFDFRFFYFKGLIEVVPFYLFMCIILNILVLIIVIFLAASDIKHMSKDFKKVLLRLNPDSFMNKYIRKLFWIIQIILFIITGHPFCFIYKIISIFLYTINLEVAKDVKLKVEDTL